MTAKKNNNFWQAGGLAAVVIVIVIITIVIIIFFAWVIFVLWNLAADQINPDLGITFSSAVQLVGGIFWVILIITQIVRHFKSVEETKNRKKKDVYEIATGDEDFMKNITKDVLNLF
jgi:TRAP-type C4-dicarboxylate transport system permease small subunit